MHHIGLAINTIGGEIGAAAQHGLRLTLTRAIDTAEDDEFVVENIVSDPATFVRLRQPGKVRFVEGCTRVIRLGVIQHAHLNPTGERSVHCIDNRLQLILVDRNVQRPLRVHRTFDKAQQSLQESVLQPQPRRVGPGLDGEVLVGADLRVEVGKFALEGLTGGHGTVEYHALVGRMTVVTGDAQLQ